MDENYGRRTGNFQRLKEQIRARHDPCFICGQPINYDAEAGAPDSFTVEHREPRSLRPELAEDPGNLVAAHSRCNKARGTRPYRPGLGNRSREW